MGKKSTFRLLNRGSAKALDKVVELDGMNIVHLLLYVLHITSCALNISYTVETRKEVLIVKTTIHDIMSKMIQVCTLFSKYFFVSDRFF